MYIVLYYTLKQFKTSNSSKTATIAAFTTNKMPQPHTPTMYEKHTVDCTVDGVRVAFNIWDSSGIFNEFYFTVYILYDIIYTLYTFYLRKRRV